MGTDDLAYQQVDESQNQSQGRGLAGRAACPGKEHLTVREVGIGRQNLVHRLPLSQPFLNHGERSRTGDGVHSGTEDRLRHRPVRHDYGEGDQKEDTAHQGGVEDVVSQASECHLGDAYGHHAAYHGHPPGSRGRKVERQKHSGHYGRQVTDRGLPAEHVFLNQVLQSHADEH